MNIAYATSIPRARSAKGLSLISRYVTVRNSRTRLIPKISGKLPPFLTSLAGCQKYNDPLCLNLNNPKSASPIPLSSPNSTASFHNQVNFAKIIVTCHKIPITLVTTIRFTQSLQSKKTTSLILTKGHPLIIQTKCKAKSLPSHNSTLLSKPLDPSTFSWKPLISTTVITNFNTLMNPKLLKSIKLIWILKSRKNTSAPLPNSVSPMASNLPNKSKDVGMKPLPWSSPPSKAPDTLHTASSSKKKWLPKLKGSSSKNSLNLISLAKTKSTKTKQSSIKKLSVLSRKSKIPIFSTKSFKICIGLYFLSFHPKKESSTSQTKTDKRNQEIWIFLPKIWFLICKFSVNLFWKNKEGICLTTQNRSQCQVKKIRLCISNGVG